MPKLKNSFNFSTIKDIKELVRFLGITFSYLTDIFNGKLEFDLNIWTSTVEVSFLTGNEVQVQHSLGRMPKGYYLAKSNVSTNIFDGVTPNTEQYIYLRSSAAAITKVVIF